MGHQFNRWGLVLSVKSFGQRNAPRVTHIQERWHWPDNIANYWARCWLNHDVSRCFCAFKSWHLLTIGQIIGIPSQNFINETFKSANLNKCRILKYANTGIQMWLWVKHLTTGWLVLAHRRQRWHQLGLQYYMLLDGHKFSKALLLKRFPQAQHSLRVINWYQ